ncbi:MAG: hypothetical protein H7Y38_05775 [Armatimonadetes bacterium]|nr:hypothetical protein [Armatimonadota bacterium]
MFLVNRFRTRRSGMPRYAVNVASCVCATLAAVFLRSAPATAQVTVFAGNLSGFNAAAGNPPVAIDFDAIPAGTDITGLTVAGVVLSTTGAPLIVVDGNATTTPTGFSGVIDASTNRLFPTTGANVLSPGGSILAPGSNPAVEDDDLTITFDSAVSAFGFDHLSQSRDGFSFTTITVLDAGDVTLFSGAIPIGGPGGGAPGGADFWGITSLTANIKTVRINEQDGDSAFPDANIGYDTLRFVSAPAVVPEAGTLALLGCALAPVAFGVVRRRGQK